MVKLLELSAGGDGLEGSITVTRIDEVCTIVITMGLSGVGIWVTVGASFKEVGIVCRELSDVSVVLVVTTVLEAEDDELVVGDVSELVSVFGSTSVG